MCRSQEVRGLWAFFLLSMIVSGILLILSGDNPEKPAKNSWRCLKGTDLIQPCHFCSDFPLPKNTTSPRSGGNSTNKTATNLPPDFNVTAFLAKCNPGNVGEPIPSVCCCSVADQEFLTPMCPVWSYEPLPETIVGFALCFCGSCLFCSMALLEIFIISGVIHDDYTQRIAIPSPFTQKLKKV